MKSLTIFGGIRLCMVAFENNNRVFTPSYFRGGKIYSLIGGYTAHEVDFVGKGVIAIPIELFDIDDIEGSVAHNINV